VRDPIAGGTGSGALAVDAEEERLWVRVNYRSSWLIPRAC